MEDGLAAACTKARANWGMFLKKEQYEKLFESKGCFEALKCLNENKRYREVLKNSSLNENKLIQIEEKFMQTYMNEIYKFSYYLHGNYELLLKTIFLKYQIEDIKKVLRSKYKKYNSKNEILFMTEKCPMNKLNFKKLLDAATLEETAELLRKTAYYNSIQGFLKDKSKMAYFKCEMQLDIEYFNAVNDLNRRFKGKNAASQLIGEYEDLLILKTIFRQKKYFNNVKLVPDTQYKIAGYKLTEEDIRTFYEAGDADEFLKLTEKFKFSGIYEESLRDGSSIERKIDAYMKKRYVTQKKKNGNTIAVVIAYFELLMDEMKSIISILECRKYKLSADEAKEYVI